MATNLKSNIRTILTHNPLGVTCLFLLAAAPGVLAQTTIIKANTTTMSAAADWGSTPPSNATVGRFDATISAGDEAGLALGGNVTLAGLLFSGAMNGPVTIGSGNILTLDSSLYPGAAGIDMSAANQNVTFNNALTLHGKQAWKVASGETLTIGVGPTTTGAGVDFTGFAGTLGTLADVNGILGPWATTGSGTSMQYATVAAGTVSGYSGGTPLPATGGAATANYTVAASTALTASESANTVQATGAGGYAVSANTLTVNGVMNGSSGLLTISSGVTIGANKELVLTGPGNTTISSVIANNGGGASALTCNGTGIFTNNANSTYTGPITINSGVFVATTAGNTTSGSSGSLGNANTAGRTITINSGGELDFSHGNIMGKNGSTKNVNLPAFVINGGKLVGKAASDALGSITLNGGTIVANCTAPGSSSAGPNYATVNYYNAYLSFQLGGNVTVTGNSPSFINGNGLSFANAQDGLSLISSASTTTTPTTFTVANVTGDATPANVDLTVSAAIGDDNADCTALSGGQLVKAGPGTMLLTGLNFYRGGTTVEAGTLEVGTTDNQALPAYTTANGGTGNMFGGKANVAGALGLPGTAVILGDANTTLNNASPALLIAGAFTVGHPIVISNNATTGRYLLGGSTDNNAAFTNLITINQPLTISQVANAGANALTISGGIVSSNGSQTVTFAGPGNVMVTTTPLANGSGTLGVNVAGGDLFLTVAPTYTGTTTVNGTLDVTGLAGGTLVLGGTLIGSGTVNGSLSAAAGTAIYPGTAGPTVGTLTINSNLSLSSSSTVYFDLSTSHLSGNDQINVGGNLTLNGGVINLNALSGSANLDGGSYVLFAVTNSSSGTLPSVAWVGTAPGNAANYSLAQVNNNIVLQHQSTLAPIVTATVTPTPATRDQNVTVNATVTAGTYPVAGVTVNLSAIGGATAQAMTTSDNIHFSWTQAISPGTPLSLVANDKSLTVIASDNGGGGSTLSDTVVVPLTVVAAAEVWNGAGNGNWSNGADWVSTFAPLPGDSVAFAGTQQLTLNLDASYSIASLTFNSNAGGFSLTRMASATLDRDGGGVTNNSPNPQTIGVHWHLGGTQNIEAAAGNILSHQHHRRRRTDG